MSSLVARPQHLCRRPSSEADRTAAVKGRQAKLVARTVRLKALRVGPSYTRILNRNADYFPVFAAPSASVCMPVCNQYE